MTTAVAEDFPHGARVSYVMYLLNNVTDYLRDKVGTNVRQRKTILKCPFVLNSVATANDSVIFDL